jgi:hypothetical protein
MGRSRSGDEWIVHDLMLDVVENILIQFELTHERSTGYPAARLEHVEHIVQRLLEVHESAALILVPFDYRPILSVLQAQR